MAARFYIGVVCVIAASVGLTLAVAAPVPPITQAPPLPVPVPLPMPMPSAPAEKSNVQEALKAVRAGLDLPAVSIPPAPVELPQTVQAPEPLPVAPTPVPVPAPAAVQPAPLPPLTVGGLTVDGHQIDLATFRTRLAGGCSTCGHSDCETCGGSRHCSPGRKACEPFPSTNPASRFVGVLYESVCCPDPCYEPKWTSLADAAFFTAAARPVSHTRIRWDSGIGLTFPDRAEYFWARADGLGLGPRPVLPNRTATRVNYQELSMYTETAVTPALSMIFDVPYRTNSAIGASPGAGFGDMRIGTKTLLSDSELAQVSLQFLTYLPVGRSLKGTGVGHVSLEPSLIVGLKVSDKTFIQAQLIDWIPLGGFPGYSGNLLQYNASVNHILWRPVRDVQLLGTLEFTGMTFLDGAYTDPVKGPNQNAAGVSLFSLGPGIRLNICDKMDFGTSAAFGVSNPSFADAVIRTEFRYRY